ncbi:L domain-like protein [Anaeromyces robustus]|uniref:L domain-like protein n=1 Tax=Anaeromyces robustus TaxID=1754192 RepID=A0A1Y1WCT8_9FUNG|nr:L domain-like protein [Anaeromyces robustus]|eukprot:ORX71036.1 L domain-like protein [Anaeromyces robustus]
MNIKFLLTSLSYISITFAATLTCNKVKKQICSSCDNDNFQCKADKNGNIYSLYLVNDKITSIPQKIVNLKNLRRLDLRTNKLTTIPNDIGKLSNLKYLKLSNNDIDSIPSSIGNLKELISFGIEVLTGYYENL